MPTIKYNTIRPKEKRRHYIDGRDVDVLLSRLPHEVWSRLRAVHFNDRSVGCRRLGYVNLGHREIAICALPPRVSLTRFLVRGTLSSPMLRQTPAEFGAARGRQWPLLAIRRFMLYDVFLHELGHLQIVLPRAKRTRRRFASETKAQEFANYWRSQLWSQPFDHEDPVHNPPSKDELAALALPNPDAAHIRGADDLLSAFCLTVQCTTASAGPGAGYHMTAAAAILD